MADVDVYTSYQYPWHKNKDYCSAQLGMELLHLFHITASADASCEISAPKTLG